MRREGWHHALDVQMDFHKWSSTREGQLFHYGVAIAQFTDGKADVDIPEDVVETAMVTSRHIQESLWRGDTMFITAEMQQLILAASQDLPDEAVVLDPTVLMSDYGFVMFEHPIVGEDRNGNPIATNAMLWGTILVSPPKDGEDPTRACVLYFLTDPFEELDRYNEAFREPFVKRGLPLPVLALSHLFPWEFETGIDYEKRGIRGMDVILDQVKFFLAMQMLSHQAIGEPVQMRPDRATRKRFARTYPDLPEKLITLITLRRKSVKHDKEPGTVEWQR
ncbi:MAG TPA: hypothetical protein VJQ25_02235, partial [Nitrospira sp.]|nr:hypothetical protein [Nitrospira sp.]